MKYLLLILIWIPQEIVFTADVAKITTQMSEQVHEERGLCLKYKEVGDMLIVYDYMIPTTISTSIHQLVTHPCPADYGITWHSHNAISMISTSLQEYYTSVTGLILTKSDQMVYLSGQDIKYALYHSPEYMMVQVSRNKYAWWHISQIEEGDIQLPIKGQSALPSN